MAHPHRCTSCHGSCKGIDPSSLHLHVEIEHLKQKLAERENHIVTMETNFLTEVDKYPNGECAALTEELLLWQEKYNRLYEAHKRIQKVNQNLEDKLLKIVDKCETEKFSMSRDVVELKQKLSEANGTIICLKDENERTRSDVNLAIQLLQCKPSNFVSHKFESLPTDLQQKVKLYVSDKKKAPEGGSSGVARPEMKTIKVPIPTFPPTAMYYSVNKSDDNNDEESDKSVDIVSAAIVAKILEEREKERRNIKHCISCVCPARRTAIDHATQTLENPRRNVVLEGEGDIIRVESYQSASPDVGSVTLIERAVGPSSTVLKDPISPLMLSSTTPPRKNDQTKLNLGRNRYHSSKLCRGANRRRDRSAEYTQLNFTNNSGTAHNSQIHIDNSGEVSCDLAKSDRDRGSEIDGSRKCSVSIYPSATCSLLMDPIPTSPTANSLYKPYLISSASSSASSIDDRPTETQI